MEPLVVINEINNILKENFYKNKINDNLDDVIKFYSSDFCALLLRYFPNGTIMISNDYLNCALLINNKLYNCNGVINNLNDYHIANSEEINYIKLGLNHLSDEVFNKVSLNIKEDNISYLSLRKNNNKFI